MMLNSHYRRLALLICLLLNLTPIEAKPKNAILLSEVASLTFHKGAKTAHRRVSAIPQLKCVGGSAQGLHEPDVVRCRNVGASYSKEDVEWTCTSTLPEEFKLGSTNVVCEGYSSPDDPYILKGSCGLEYRLILTKKGEEVYANRRGRQRQYDYDDQGSGIPGTLFWIIFLGVGGYIVWSAYQNWYNQGAGRGGQGRRRGYGRGGGGGGGGFDDGHDDPPPPYSQFPSSSQYKGSRSSSYASAGPSGSSGRNSGSWQPGFGTGAALGSMAGAAAGYAAGRRGNTDYNQRQGGWGSWFGGGGGSRYTRGPDMAESSRMGSSSSSGRTHTSTGFGGTSRR